MSFDVLQVLGVGSSKSIPMPSRSLTLTSKSHSRHNVVQLFWILTSKKCSKHRIVWRFPMISSYFLSLNKLDFRIAFSPQCGAFYTHFSSQTPAPSSYPSDLARAQNYGKAWQNTVFCAISASHKNASLHFASLACLHSRASLHFWLTSPFWLSHLPVAHHCPQLSINRKFDFQTSFDNYIRAYGIRMWYIYAILYI